MLSTQRAWPATALVARADTPALRISVTPTR
jgi:hypothetical protein